MADPTDEQRKAIRAFIDSTLLPLIGDVLEKKLTQAALFMRDELSGKTAYDGVTTHPEFGQPQPFAPCPYAGYCMEEGLCANGCEIRQRINDARGVETSGGNDGRP